MPKCQQACHTGPSSEPQGRDSQECRQNLHRATRSSEKPKQSLEKTKETPFIKLTLLTIHLPIKFLYFSLNAYLILLLSYSIIYLFALVAAAV